MSHLTLSPKIVLLDSLVEAIRQNLDTIQEYDHKDIMRLVCDSHQLLNMIDRESNRLDGVFAELYDNRK